jgi:hypothetical protein
MPHKVIRRRRTHREIPTASERDGAVNHYATPLDIVPLQKPTSSVPQMAMLTVSPSIRVRDRGRQRERHWYLEQRVGTSYIGDSWRAVAITGERKTLKYHVAQLKPGVITESVASALAALPTTFEHGALARVAARALVRGKK